MTTSIFVFLVTALSLICSLFTEAIKKTFKNEKPTLVALILSIICGWGGGTAAYILMNIPFDVQSIICLVLLAPAIWLIATLGYDKVMEVIAQIVGTQPKG